MGLGNRELNSSAHRNRRFQVEGITKKAVELALAGDLTASRALAEACERNEVSKGDLVICAVWPHGDELPPSRWVTHKQVSDRELRAIIATLKLRIGFCDEARGHPEASHMSSDELFQCLADVV